MPRLVTRRLTIAFTKSPSRSCKRNRGDVSQGKASPICCAVQAAVGCAVTFQWTIPYCPSARPSRQSRGAFIVVEQTAQTRTAANAANDAARRRRTRDQRVLQALVIALVMIVRDVFRDRPSEMPLANRNQPIEA